LEIDTASALPRQALGSIMEVPMRGFACMTGWFCLATVVWGFGCGSDADPAGDDSSSDTAGTGGESSGGGAILGTAGMTSSGGSGAAGTGAAGKSGGTGQGGATGSGTGGNAGTAGRAGTAGAGGQAGAGGSGGSAPHVTGKCDGLGAVGQWENITPPNITLTPPYTGVIVVLEDPQTSGTIYATTSKNGVLRSTDCGATWTKTNTGRNAHELDSGFIWSAVIDPVAPKTLYALTGYGPSGLWKTTNAGVDWDQMLPSGTGMPGFVARVTIDPTNHLHLIINFHDNCTGGHTPVCMGETKDGGATWKVLDFPASIKNGWGEGTSVMPIDEKHWVFEFWELYSTSDAGATWTRTSDGLAVQGSYFHAAGGAYYLGAQNGVLTSPDGITWSRIPNSGGGHDAVIGDGTRLFAFDGFQPPSGPTFAWSAPYSDPTKWSVLATPGLPAKLSAGFTGIDYDPDHHLLYTSIQAEGLWRMVTK
jgi:hypothetical protein